MFEAIKSAFRKLLSGSTPVDVSPKLPEATEANGPQLPSFTEKRKVKLGLIVGHTRSASGATMCAPYQYSEYEYNSELAKLAKHYSMSRTDIIADVITRDGLTIEEVYELCKEEGYDFVIELHFNAANGNAIGTETLCTIEQVDKDFASQVHWGICKALGREGSSRGVKCISRSARGGENIHQMPGTANCLVEPFFGDHPDDAKLGIDKMEALAMALIDSTTLWAKKVHLL